MKFDIKITKTLEGTVEIEAENAAAALKAAEEIYNNGAELPDMEDGTPLRFSLDNEIAQERPSKEEVERYMKAQGYPDTALFFVQQFVQGENADMFNEAVLNNYSLDDVQRWVHLKNILGSELSFRAAMMVDTALWFEDLNTLDMTSREDILLTPNGIAKQRLEKLAEELSTGKQRIRSMLKLSDESAKFLVNAFNMAIEPEKSTVMDISIYMINKQRDPDRLTFFNYETVSKHHGGSINASIYDKVYEGTVEAETLEDVYYIFNVRHPADYRNRSLSMSDVVEVKTDAESHFYFCDTVGFRRIDFDARLSQVRDGLKPSLASQIDASASRSGTLLLKPQSDRNKNQR